MAALIDISNNRANIAFANQTPWHGLGTNLPADADMDEWRRQAGMEWRAEKAPVEYITPAGPQTSDEHFVVYRNDTNAALGIASGRYVAVQPGEVIDFYRELCASHGFAMETAGCLKGGKLIWALARADGSVMLPGQDRVDQYVLLSTSYDGSMATTGRWTTVRVVCANTLNAALRTKADFSLRHSSAFDPAEARKILLPQSDFAEFAETARKLAETPVTPEQSVEFFMAVYHDLRRGAVVSPRMEKSVEKTVERLSAQYLGAPGASLASSKGTAWGLVNAVTHDIDHARKAKSNESRLTSAWYGQGNALKVKAVSEALALAA